MLNLLKRAAGRALTENGAATYATTQSDCLDLFSTIGALRQASEPEIINRFTRAYAENPTLAMKILFFARDARGGLGERRVFRILLRHLAQNDPGPVLRNLERVAYYGRFDDLLSLMNTPCQQAMIDLAAKQLQSDLAALQEGGQISLLAKWMPSINASSKQTVADAKKMARALRLSDAQYRKTLSRLRVQIGILENNLRLRDYSFDYSKQPSRAMFKYRRAFFRNDAQRYRAFLAQVERGDATLHTGALYPYEVILPCLKGYPDVQQRAALDATWKALPNYATGEDALVVVDGSGSMYAWGKPCPASVALSLGIYFAERNRGRFQNHFITFSERPQLVEIKGRDLFERVRYCASYNEVANTNIEAVFELLLRTAVANHLPQSELPSTLYIVSDMEFDRCARNAQSTNFENARRLFAKRGYQLPKVVFWNVASRNLQQPVTQNEQGVALVSGCSPRLFEMVLSGRLSAYDYMVELLNRERYAGICA